VVTDLVIDLIPKHSSFWTRRAVRRFEGHTRYAGSGRYRALSDDHVGDDISRSKYYGFDEDFLIELEACSTHYEMYDK
jgi:hypothetical protein